MTVTWPGDGVKLARESFEMGTPRGAGGPVGSVARDGAARARDEGVGARRVRLGVDVRVRDDVLAGPGDAARAFGAFPNARGRRSRARRLRRARGPRRVRGVRSRCVRVALARRRPFPAPLRHRARRRRRVQRRALRRPRRTRGIRASSDASSRWRSADYDHPPAVRRPSEDAVGVESALSSSSTPRGRSPPTPARSPGHGPRRRDRPTRPAGGGLHPRRGPDETRRDPPEGRGGRTTRPTPTATTPPRTRRRRDGRGRRRTSVDDDGDEDEDHVVVVIHPRTPSRSPSSVRRRRSRRRAATRARRDHLTRRLLPALRDASEDADALDVRVHTSDADLCDAVRAADPRTRCERTATMTATMPLLGHESIVEGFGGSSGVVPARRRT